MVPILVMTVTLAVMLVTIVLMLGMSLLRRGCFVSFCFACFFNSTGSIVAQALYFSSHAWQAS